MSNVRAVGNFWSDALRAWPEARVQRGRSASKVQAVEVVAGEADPAPSTVATTVPKAVPAVQTTSAASTSSLLNLYHQALSVEATGQNQSWVVVPPPQQAGEVQVPQSAARTSAEAAARAAYALVAEASRKRPEPARVLRQG